MTRILLRGPRDPFETPGPARTLAGNLIAGNSGNLVFLDAAHKLLSAPGVEIRPDRLSTAGRLADRINAEYSAYVIPLANAFRPSFQQELDRMTALIERLRIPVVVLGVGAQMTVDANHGRLRSIESSVKAFVRAVLDRGPSIGVRGEVTAEYLAGLGFRDVEVIGCPSMFLWGPELQVAKRAPALTAASRIAITISPYVKAMGPIIRHHLEAYPSLIYIAQDLRSLELMLWGRDVTTPHSDLPVDVSHPLFRQDKARFFLSPWPWIAELRGQDFSFGTRIHGGIAALLAGTPSVVLAHDSRTLELARYFAIPHRLMSAVRPDLDAAELYAEADYTALMRGHAGRFEVLTSFLERHRLDHVFAHDGAAEAWDARIARVSFPGAVRRGNLAAWASEPSWRWHRAMYKTRALGKRVGFRTLVRSLRELT